MQLRSRAVLRGAAARPQKRVAYRQQQSSAPRVAGRRTMQVSAVLPSTDEVQLVANIAEIDFARAAQFIVRAGIIYFALKYTSDWIALMKERKDLEKKQAARNDIAAKQQEQLDKLSGVNFAAGLAAGVAKKKDEEEEKKSD